MLLSSNLGIIITLNSNNINKQKLKSNLVISETKNNLYNPKWSIEKIYLNERKLSNDLYESNQFCSMTSNELQEYYKTDIYNDQKLPKPIKIILMS